MIARSIKLLSSERFRRLTGEGIWIIFGQAIAVIGAIVGVRLLTELMSPGAYGELALGMTIAALVNQVILGPLSNGITRYYAPALEQDELGGYLAGARLLTLRATLAILLAIPLAVIGLTLFSQQGWIAISIASLVFAIVSGYNAILNGLQNAARQRKVVAIHQGMESWGRFLIAAGLLVLVGASGTVALAGYTLATIVVLASQYLYFQKTVKTGATNSTGRERWLKNMLDYSWPFATWGIFGWAQIASDRWALGVFSTTKDVGFYAVLYQLGYYPMSIAVGLATQFLAPIFFEGAGDGSDASRNARVSKLSGRFTLLIFGSTLTAFLVTYLFHAQLFGILVAEEYASVSYLLPWILLGSGIFAAGQAIALDLMSQMKTREMMAAKIITALLGVSLNFAGAYWYGVKGVVASGIAFSVLYYGWMMLLLRKQNFDL